MAVYFEDDSDSASQPSGRGKKKTKRKAHGDEEHWHSGPMPDVLKVRLEPMMDFCTSPAAHLQAIGPY